MKMFNHEDFFTFGPAWDCSEFLADLKEKWEEKNRQVCDDCGCWPCLCLPTLRDNIQREWPW